MSSTKKVRMVLDIILTVMIVFEMFIQYTGEFLHEVVGFAFFATVIAHLAISAKWIRSTAKAAQSGKMSARRGALAVMGILLTVTMVVLGVSSVAISSLLSSAGLVWTLGSYGMWATVHAVSSYALCGLVTIHLAMHWAFLASVLKVPYDPSRRRAIGVGVHAAAAVGAMALGVLAVGEAMPRTASAAVSNGNTAASGNAASSGNSGRSGFEGPVNDRSLGSEASGSSAGSSTSGTGSTSSSGTSAGSNSSSSASASSTGKGGRKKDKGARGQSSNGSSTSGPSANSSSNSVSGSGSLDTSPIAEDDASAVQDDYYSNDSRSDQESSTVEGICTLCRKRCPLSAPQCNRPYEAGLI